MALRDYVDPRARGLFNKVDFAGLIADIGRGAFLAALTAVTGFIIAAQRSFEWMLMTVENAIRGFFIAIFGAPAASMIGAVEGAAAELPGFGLAALPIATAVSLSVLFVIAIFAWFWGVS